MKISSAPLLLCSPAPLPHPPPLCYNSRHEPTHPSHPNPCMANGRTAAHASSRFGQHWHGELFGGGRRPF
ncbi:MAG: hypothetical protein OT477_23375 [Chloroflexi bacterium]|nr:hypothetical protein [Chloroflexota bacterium]